MRNFGYWTGLVLLVAGAAAGIAELLMTFMAGPDQSVTLGVVWYRIHANSLVGFQGLIEKSVSPAVWVPIQYVLTLPAWIILIPPGALLTALCRPRRSYFD